MTSKQTTEESESKELTLEVLQKAVAGSAVALRCRTKMQPAGGEGTKVFPPTYAGAVYAMEKRRLPGYSEPVDCVLLDSVQSQANRMEEALQRAVDEGNLTLPLVEVDFTPYFPGDDEPEEMRLLYPIGKISSLQAPHRIADAILRDSLYKEKKFRESDIGQMIDRVSYNNATPLFEICPTALLFGMWDSTGPKGGLGAKFERAMVSEIVGVNAVMGVKTSSRIDPLGIQKNAGPLYRRHDDEYTLNPDEAVDEIIDGKPTGKKLLYKRNKKGQDVFHDPKEEKYPNQGRPSEANLGNVTPDIDYRRNQNNVLIKDDFGKPIPVGGVTIDYAEQTTVISLPALRRLHFTENNESGGDNAGRTVLAALGLCAATLANDAGLDLRSRCLLYTKQVPTWTLLDCNSDDMAFSIKNAISLLKEAVNAAKNKNLEWKTEPINLKPSPGLIQLIVKSQRLAAKQVGDAEEEE